MAGKVKTWGWVVIGLLGTCVVMVVAVAGAGVYFVAHHFKTHTASPLAAAREFDSVRADFKGQKPLVELDHNGNFLRANDGRASVATIHPPQQINVLAFDPDDSRVVRLTIPFWLLRFKMGRGSIDFNGRRMNLEDLKVRVEDLERYGPTLIVDHTMADGNRVLVWSQ